MATIVVVSQPGGRFSSKDPGASEFFYWDFTKKLKPGETVLSAVVVANSLIDGADNTAAMVAPDTALVMNGAVVRQLIGGGTSGIPYRMTAVGTTSLGQELPLSGILPIGPEYGVAT